MITPSRSALPRWHEMTAFFGGRFDPPHLGHREAVAGLLKEPGVRSVRILPSAAPPHKPTWASMEDRTEMARLNFTSRSTPEIQVDSRELDRSKANPTRPSYSYDTLMGIQAEVPAAAFVLGSDQLTQLFTWYRFPEILNLSHWIVLERRPLGGSSVQQTLEEWKASGLIQRTAEESTWRVANSSKFLITRPTAAPNISSTTIRESIARTGSPPEESLLTSVLAYLKERKLYGI